jgi:hypothetical protein
VHQVADTDRTMFDKSSLSLTRWFTWIGSRQALSPSLRPSPGRRIRCRWLSTMRNANKVPFGGTDTSQRRLMARRRVDWLKIAIVCMQLVLVNNDDDAQATGFTTDGSIYR